MKKDTFGTILKNRIKEMGYTQEEFAEKVGIGLSSLKKYMNDTYVYKVDLLPKFAEVLECSYDYLLGYSRSPIREHSDISNELHLSDEAIANIKRMVARDEDDFYYIAFFYVLNAILENDDLLFTLTEYVSGSRYVENQLRPLLDVLDQQFTKTMPFENAKMKMDTFMLLSIYNELALIRENKPDKLRQMINEMVEDENILMLQELVIKADE